MKTEFTTFCIKKGKEELAEEWMQVLSNRKDDCVETLSRGKMVFESIFKHYKDGRLYLSWFSVQKDGYQRVETSEHEIDKLHLKYWNECVDKSIRPVNHTHVVSFVPRQLEVLIGDLYDS
jgi:hypothetical protein